MNREDLFRALLVEFVGEASLPSKTEMERLIRDALDRRLTPRQFLDELLDACDDPSPAPPKPKWLH